MEFVVNHDHEGYISKKPACGTSKFKDNPDLFAKATKQAMLEVKNIWTEDPSLQKAVSELSTCINYIHRQDLNACLEYFVCAKLDVNTDYKTPEARCTFWKSTHTILRDQDILDALLQHFSIYKSFATLSEQPKKFILQSWLHRFFSALLIFLSRNEKPPESEETMSMKKDSSEKITGTIKEAGTTHSFQSVHFDEIQVVNIKEFKESPSVEISSTCQDLENIKDQNESVLHHIGGYIINYMQQNSTKFECQTFLKNSLDVNNHSNYTHFSKKTSRGKLKILSNEGFQFFKKLDMLANVGFLNRTYNKINTKNQLTTDPEILQNWYVLWGNSNNLDVAKTTFSKIVGKFLNVKTKGLVNKWKALYQKKTSLSLKGKAGLRKTLKENKNNSIKKDLSQVCTSKNPLANSNVDNTKILKKKPEQIIRVTNKTTRPLLVRLAGIK